MKICYLNHDLRRDTGAGRFGRSFLAAASKTFPDVEPILLVQEQSGAPGEIALLPSSKIGFLIALPRIRAIFRECDIIHALDGYPYGVVAMLAAFGLQKPLVITAIGTGALRPLRIPIIGWLLRRAYRSANRVVAVSNFTRRELIREIGPLEISVINHGVDAERFSRPVPADASERAMFQRLRPYVISVGALKPRKGFFYSIGAFAQLKKRFPGLRYVVVGEGSESEALQEHVHSLGLRVGEDVIFRGKLTELELVSAYQAAELFCLLPVDDSRDVEGFGLVFLEAAAAGLPVVGANGSGAEDAIADGRNGVLVAPRDPAAAAAAMAEILSDSEIRRRFASGSRAFAEEKNWGRVAASYGELYRAILVPGVAGRVNRKVR